LKITIEVPNDLIIREVLRHLESVAEQTKTKQRSQEMLRRKDLLATPATHLQLVGTKHGVEQAQKFLAAVIKPKKRSHAIRTVEDLCRKSENLLGYHDSLKGIDFNLVLKVLKDTLAQHGLSLGMNIPKIEAYLVGKLKLRTE
jgi:hypothetical protein